MVEKQVDLVPGEISELELGWLAGLWEGEGHFGYDRTQLAHIRMTDKDVILKTKAMIERVFGLDPITFLEQQSNRKNEQSLFGIQTYGATARGIMRLLLPLMGNRRRAQIWRSLNEFRPKKLPANFIKRIFHESN